MSVSKDLVFGEAVTIAGGADESISQPRWDDGDRLVFLSDRTGYYELYSWDKGTVELVLEKPTGVDVGGVPSLYPAMRLLAELRRNRTGLGAGTIDSRFAGKVELDLDRKRR